MITYQQNNFIILTGAPGGGKTTLINHFRKLGLFCLDEPARLILAEQRANIGNGLPEKDKKLFTELLLARSVQNFESATQQKKTVIFDRGVADTVGYANYFGIDSTAFESAAEKYRYNSTVFVLPPWKAIYKTDDERKMSFEESEIFHHLLVAPYRKLGSKLIDVPFESVENRAQFFLDKISEVDKKRGLLG